MMRTDSKHARLMVVFCALAFAIACGDKKKPQNDKPQPPDKTVKQPMKKSPTAKTPIKTPTETTVVVKTTPPTKKTVTPKVEPKTSSPISANQPVKVPPSVIIVGGLQSFSALVTKVDGLVAKFRQFPVAILMLGGMQRALGLTSMAWLKKDAPIRFAVWSPKATRKPVVIVFPTTDKSAFVAAMPASKKPGDGGNAFSIVGRRETVYVNFIPNHVVLTLDPALFVKAEEYVKTKLIQQVVKHPLSVTVSVANLSRIFGPQIQALSQLATSANLPVGLSGLVKKTVAFVVGLVNDADTLTAGFEYRGDLLQFSLELKPKQDSSLATFVSSLKGHDFSMLNMLPAGTWFALSMNMDKKYFQALNDAVSGVNQYSLKTVYKFTDAEILRAQALTKKMAELTGGEMHMALHTDGPYALALSAFYRVGDPAAYKKAVYAYFQMFIERGLALAKGKLGQKIPLDNVKTLDQVVKVLQPFAAKLGVSVKLATQGKIDYLSVKYDMVKIASLLKPGMDPALKQKLAAWQKVLGSTFEVALGFDANLAVGSLGPNAVKQVEAILAKQSSASPILANAKKGLAPNSVFSLIFAPIPFAKTLVNLPVEKLSKIRATFTGMEATSAVTLSLGGASELVLLWNLPVNDTVQLIKAGIAAYQAMNR